jgi:hypothetical protein
LGCLFSDALCHTSPALIIKHIAIGVVLEWYLDNLGIFKKKGRSMQRE